MQNEQTESSRAVDSFVLTKVELFGRFCLHRVLPYARLKYTPVASDNTNTATAPSRTVKKYMHQESPIAKSLVVTPAKTEAERGSEKSSTPPIHSPHYEQQWELKTLEAPNES